MIGVSLDAYALLQFGLVWFGLAWLGLAWLGLAWHLGIADIGIDKSNNFRSLKLLQCVLT